MIFLALALTLVLAGMGYAGLPLGVATSMFTALTLGIGVDLDDYDLFADCLTGPAVEVMSGCHNADLDWNTRVDLRDFAKLQAAFDPGL